MHAWYSRMHASRSTAMRPRLFLFEYVRALQVLALRVGSAAVRGLPGWRLALPSVVGHCRCWLCRPLVLFRLIIYAVFLNIYRCHPWEFFFLLIDALFLYRTTLNIYWYPPLVSCFFLTYILFPYLTNINLTTMEMSRTRRFPRGLLLPMRSEIYRN